MFEVDKLFDRHWVGEAKTKKQAFSSDAESLRNRVSDSDSETLLLATIDSYRNTSKYKAPDPITPTHKGIVLDVLFPELLFRINTRSNITSSSGFDSRVYALESLARTSCILFRMARKSLKVMNHEFSESIIDRIDNIRSSNCKLYDSLYMRIGAVAFVTKNPKLKSIFIDKKRSHESERPLSLTELTTRSQDRLKAKIIYDRLNYQKNAQVDAVSYSDSDLVHSFMYHMLQIKELKEIVPGEPDYSSVLFYTQIPELLDRLSWKSPQWSKDLICHERYVKELELLIAESRDVVLQAHRQLSNSAWHERSDYINMMSPFIKKTSCFELKQPKAEVLSFIAY